jgi:class 3 adenylate cyclase
VLIRDGAPYGDGVNLAARIRGAAQPGQIVVSEDVER